MVKKMVRIGKPLPYYMKNDVLGIYCWSRFYAQKKDFIQANCGDRGDGKSTAALRQAELYDATENGTTRFDIKRCVFSPSDFLKQVRSDLRPGSYIIWDETGLELSSRRWYSLQNFVISGVVQSMRYKRLGAIFTYPHFSLIDKNVRTMFQAYLEMRNINHVNNYSEGILRVISTNSYTGDMYLKNMRWTSDSFVNYFCDNGLSVKIPFRYRFKIVKIFFQLPSKELVEAYEPMKEEATNAWYDRYAKEIDVMKKLALDEKTGKKVTMKEVYEAVKKDINKYLSPKTKLVDSGRVLMEWNASGVQYQMAAKVATMINDEIKANVLQLKKAHGKFEADEDEKKERFLSSAEVEERKRRFKLLMAKKSKIA